MDRVAAIVPARYASSRFPGKVLAKICGKYMIVVLYIFGGFCRKGRYGAVGVSLFPERLVFHLITSK